MKRPMDDLLGDVRFAARLLVKERAFTIVVILTLAMSIGGANTVFTIVNVNDAARPAGAQSTSSGVGRLDRCRRS